MLAVTVTIIICTLAGCYIGRIVCAASYRREIRRFTAAAKVLMRKREKVRQPAISNGDLLHVWKLATISIGQQADVGDELPNVVEIGKELAGGADEIRSISRAVGKLLAAQTSPASVAIAIVIQPSAELPPQLEHCAGLPVGRTRETLLSLFNALHDGQTGEAKWGSWIPVSGGVFDFSLFGVGSVLCVPISTSSKLRGMIWIGFPVHRPGLDRERLLFLHQVCDYCSSAFETAKKIQVRISEREKQRDFLVGMSHDLRAPGHSAMYALRDLLDEGSEQLSAEQRARLRIVEQCIEDQLDMLSDVLDFAKNQAGKLKAVKEFVDAGEFVTRILPPFRDLAIQRGLEFQISSAPRVPVEVDPSHFKRILTNLLSNALKYTDHGWIRLEIDRLQNSVSIRVIDTGVGILEEEERALFQEFSRLSTSTGRPGSGLGLSISRMLTTLNDGTLDYRRRPGGGSIFELTLPQCADREKRSSLLHAKPKLQRILVVEDDAAAGRLNRRYLSDLAHNVYVAQTCKEAVSLVDEQNPELIVSDVHLGDDSAMQMLKHLVSRSKKTPVLLLSGSADRTCSLPYESDLPIRWLSKPADRSALVSAVTDFIAASAPVN